MKASKRKFFSSSRSHESQFLAEVVDTLDVDVGVLDVELLAAGRRHVEPLPHDGVIVGAGGLTPGVDPPQRGRGQLGGDLPDFPARVVAEQVKLLRLLEVERRQKPGVRLVRLLEGPRQVVDRVRNFSVRVDGVEDLK